MLQTPTNTTYEFVLKELVKHDVTYCNILCRCFEINLKRRTRDSLDLPDQNLLFMANIFLLFVLLAAKKYGHMFLPYVIVCQSNQVFLLQSV